MDTLEQRRRPVGAAVEESGTAAGEPYRTYETALSQPGECAPGTSMEEVAGSGTPRGSNLSTLGGGNVSPNTLERGVIASPFHSQKIQEEIQLRNSRPASLDDDAKALGHIAEEESARLEREYFQQLASSGVRVARVETASHESSSPPRASGERHGGLYPAGGEIARSSSLPGTSGPRALKPLENEEVSLALVSTGPTAEGSREESQMLAVMDRSELAMTTFKDGVMRPQPEDQRELVPAGNSRVEELLIKMMEENRNLRWRLEQMETQSSWHSGNTRETSQGAVDHTPISFTPSGWLVGPKAIPVHQEGFLRAKVRDPNDYGTSTGPCAALGVSARATGPPIPPPARAMEPGVVPGYMGSLYGGRPDMGFRDVGYGRDSMGVPSVPQGCNAGTNGMGSMWEDQRHLGSEMGRGGQCQVPRFDKDGFPMSPGITPIKPPPGPPPLSPKMSMDMGGFLGESGRVPQKERPEEPAKYITELPKLGAADLGSSAVACGNWMAQIRQIFTGISPSSHEWWGSVERASTQQYQKWIIADPVDRLVLDPAGVVADFDGGKFQRVESRAVSLLLAAIPQHLRDEAVSNRWLNTSSLLFRIQCVYQPGGSSERSMLLTSLVAPEVVRSFSGAVAMLRRWQQHFYRVRELHASLPDPSLLLRGVDSATSSLLVQNPQLGFRVNTFRNRVSLDYNPTVSAVIQLVRLLQAEFESAALSSEAAMPDKKARSAALHQTGIPEKPKAVPLPKGGGHSFGEAQAKAMEPASDPKGKGKGKEKGKDTSKEWGLCHGFASGTGCKYGDACKFKHDKAVAKKEKRCMSCGLEGHFRSECPTGSPEGRSSREAPGSSQSQSVAAPKGPPAPKPKAGPQVKGVQEDAGAVTIPEVPQTGGSSMTSDTLIAEAAKLLKGVSLRPLRVDDIESLDNEGCPEDLCIDRGWLMSAVSASDPLFALVDSGATNALRQAEEGEICQARVIGVDLASGATKLHVNEYGTLLHEGPCQLILPACYLVQLGFLISWKKRGWSIKRRGEAGLQVKVVKGCPLIPKEQGLQLLKEYEMLKQKGDLPSLQALRDTPVEPLQDEDPRVWLAERVKEGSLSREDQLRWLVSMFPKVPYECVLAAAGSNVQLGRLSGEDTPWNMRRRRTIARARAGEVLLHLFAGSQKWKCPGLVVEIEKSRGSDLMSPGVFRHVLSWGLAGLVGGIVGGPPCRSVSRCRSATDGGPPPVRDRIEHRWGLDNLTGHWKEMVKEDSVLWLRFLLAYAVAQAAADVPCLRTRPIPIEEAKGSGISLSSPQALSIPKEVTEPLGLACWALAEAAKQITVSREPKNCLPPELRQPVFFVWEHPADPASYLRADLEPPGGWPSWWAFPEWQCFSDKYGLHLARLDQGN